MDELIKITLTPREGGYINIAVTLITSDGSKVTMLKDFKRNYNGFLDVMLEVNSMILDYYTQKQEDDQTLLEGN